jgi:phosphoglycolate phosphatase-like HAD superfamily hydrolase
MANILRDTPQLVPAATEVYEKLLYNGTFVNGVEAVAGTPELLTKLKGRYALALATGCPRQLLTETLMPKLGIPNIFDMIITSDEVEPEQVKPSAFMLDTIMSRLGYKPDETIMVGDAVNDVLMAQNAGVEPVVVETGHLNRYRAEKMGVQHVIPDITHLGTLLDKMH